MVHELNDGRTAAHFYFVVATIGCNRNNGDLINDTFNGEKAANTDGSGIFPLLQGKIRPATFDMGP